MIHGHPNGNQDLEVDDMVFVEFMQQKGENIKQKHTEGQAADVCKIWRKGKEMYHGIYKASIPFILRAVEGYLARKIHEKVKKERQNLRKYYIIQLLNKN